MSSPAAEAHSASTRPPRRRLRRWLGALAAVAVVVAVFGFVLPRVADYGAVWDVVSDISPAWSAILIGAAILNLATFAPPWMAGIPGLSYWHATVMTQASTAASAVLPGGDALGAGISYAMLRRWGFRAQEVAVGVAATSLWNLFVNVAFPVAAIAALAVTGEADPLLVRVAIVGVVALAVLVVLLGASLSSRRRAIWLGELAGRGASLATCLLRRGRVRGWGRSLAQMREQALVLVRRRWLALTVTTLAGHLTVFLVLLVALRALDVSGEEVSFVEAFAAWSLVRLLTAVPITPGGLGVVELGLTAALVGFGGPQVEVVAAVLVYRFLTYVPPIAIGGVCLLMAARWTRVPAAGAATGSQRPEQR
jgi:uncharacterized protein (TIRG00374 family)